MIPFFKQLAFCRRQSHLNNIIHSVNLFLRVFNLMRRFQNVTSRGRCYAVLGAQHMVAKVADLLLIP